jgi:hypothetical protein
MAGPPRSHLMFKPNKPLIGQIYLIRNNNKVVARLADEKLWIISWSTRINSEFKVGDRLYVTPSKVESGKGEDWGNIQGLYVAILDPYDDELDMKYGKIN